MCRVPCCRNGHHISWYTSDITRKCDVTMVHQRVLYVDQKTYQSLNVMSQWYTIAIQGGTQFGSIDLKV